MTESSHNWKIFWINLDRSTERRERFEERLRDFQLTDLSQRVKAVDGLQEYKERITPETVQKMDQYHLSLSEMACTLSHLDAVRLAHDSDTEFCLILEDDTTFEFLTCPFIEKLNDIVSRAPQKWQVLQIGVTYLKEKRRLQIQRVRQHAKQFLARKSEDWGSNAYILSRTAMEQLVERHWNDERKQWDFAQSPKRMTSENVVYAFPKVYLCTDFPFGFEGFDSEIHPDHLSLHNMTLDWIRRLSRAPSRFRKHTES